MKEMIKRTAVVSIITSLIFAVLGIVMIANPEAAIEIVAAVLGITVIVIGAEKIISYFVTVSYTHLTLPTILLV